MIRTEIGEMVKINIGLEETEESVQLVVNCGIRQDIDNLISDKDREIIDKNVAKIAEIVKDTIRTDLEENMLKDKFEKVKNMLMNSNSIEEMMEKLAKEIEKM